MSTDLISPERIVDISWAAPVGLTFEQYVETGRTLGAMNRACQFLLGDWVNHGEHVYGEKYSQAAEVTGYDDGTLRNYASVAGQIPPSRRNDKVPFSHHQAVTSIKDPDLQERLLARAADERLTLERFRSEVRAYRTAEPRPPAPEPQWAEPPGIDRAVEAARSAIRALAAVTRASEQVTAVWVAGDSGAEVYVEIDGQRR